MDATGSRRRVSPGSVELALQAMAAATPAPDTRSGPVFARPGEPLPSGATGIVLESGAELGSARRLPRGVPTGYHRLIMAGGVERALITSPRRAHLPSLHGWGWAAQLYAVRSERSWGIGDIADLGALTGWAARAGAGAVLINPLHAPAARLPQEPSPYFPSSRRFRNPLYIALERVPGARDNPDIAAIAREARDLNLRDVIDRDRVYALKMHALGRLWEQFRGSRQFDDFCSRQGEPLLRYACFCVLSDRHPTPWTSWPEQYRRPDSPALRRIARGERERVDFHRWLQWLLELQLDHVGDGGSGRSSARGCSVIHDVAVGFAPDGADAWEWQDLLAAGMRIGAPPDEFNRTGQDWGLPPFDPQRLRAAAYEPVRQTLRAVMRPGHGVRIDHVMGLFRLWWVPRRGSAAEGVYVRYPSRELLDIVTLESSRARAFVIGEDLGTVEAGVRAELARRALLSYRIAWFERRSPAHYPPQAVAALTTHDLPTTAGVWSGSDIREMQEWGMDVNLAGEMGVRRRLQRLAGVPPNAPVEEVIERAYAALAQAPATLLLATLDDAAKAERRPNLPGAAARPNWSLPLPRTLEQLRRDRLPRRIARALGGRR